MSRNAYFAVIDLGKGERVFKHRACGVSPESEFSAIITLSFSVGEKYTCKSVRKVSVIARYVLVAEGEYRKSAVKYLLGWLIEIRNIVSEIYMYKCRDGSFYPMRINVINGKSELTKGSLYCECELLKIAFACWIL